MQIMIRNCLLVALLSALSLTAGADFRTVSRAYEATLASVQLPVSASGTLTIRACANCKVQRFRVTSDTRYTINESEVELEEFRRQLLQVRNRDTQAVIVKHDLATDVVTSVSVRL
jgi:biopolymer transport protein ExbD